MTKISDMLRRGEYPNCSSISRELEVSVKTAQRDIEFMRDQFNQPIEYDEAKHGYYYTEEVVSLPTMTVSEGEVVALLVAQKALEQYRGTPFEHMLETAFAKLTSGLSDEITFRPSAITAEISFRSLGVSHTDLRIFEALARAVRTVHEVTIKYRKPRSSRAETRRLQPYHLACIQNLWYVIGYDLRRAAIRTFAVPRIRSLIEETASFQRPKDFSAERYLAGSFGAFTGKGTIHVKVRFDAFAAPFIRERTYHRSQRTKSLPKGELLLTMRVSRLEEVQTWVLSWGQHAQVLAPKDLVENVREAAKETLALYS